MSQLLDPLRLSVSLSSPNGLLNNATVDAGIQTFVWQHNLDDNYNLGIVFGMVCVITIMTSDISFQPNQREPNSMQIAFDRFQPHHWPLLAGVFRLSENLSLVCLVQTPLAQHSCRHKCLCSNKTRSTAIHNMYIEYHLLFSPYQSEAKRNAA